LFHRHSYRINPQQHLIDRCRHLAGKALGYAPAGPPRFELRAPTLRDPPRAPYAVFLHVTSRNDKLWPEAHWIALLEHFTRSGLTVVLPWEARRKPRAAGGSPRQAARRSCRRSASVPELAAVLARAALVVGVDTGLTHLAAALGTPTIALFVATDPRLAGVEQASARARDLGTSGNTPLPEQVIAAAGTLMRAQESC
jgi:heptosyltransferase-1